MPNRVIKESIWTSPNLNRLSDLAERHFYRILCLPDDFGCCELTPLVVKGRCYPLKENVTTSEIMAWNTELESSDIIRVWSEGDRFYAYFPTFGDHQRVRSKHLRKTPEPPESVICRQVLSSDVNCHPNPNPNPNPNPIVLSKDKTGKKTPVPSKKLPLPGSKHFNQKIPNIQQVEKLCLKIKEIGNGKFNAYQFVQKCTNENQHPQAIFDALAGMIKMWPDIKNHWTYASAIIKTKSQNYHESEYMKQAEAFKIDWEKEFFE